MTPVAQLSAVLFLGSRAACRENDSRVRPGTRECPISAPSPGIPAGPRPWPAGAVGAGDEGPRWRLAARQRLLVATLACEMSGSAVCWPLNFR